MTHKNEGKAKKAIGELVYREIYKKDFDGHPWKFLWWAITLRFNCYRSGIEEGRQLRSHRERQERSHEEGL